jgi:photosystem II stability/assembly factor-like uncharacterized protein
MLTTVILLLPLLSLLFAVPHWTPQTSGVTARLRGVSAVSERVTWASGSGSTVLRTSDGGNNWQQLTVTSETLDFRDIDAIDERTAYVLSIGNGAASRIYKTIDGGATWTLQFKNEDPKAFLDAMSFWDADHGIVFGDSIDGKLDILTTQDGGGTWSRLSSATLPAALPNEGAFAASGTNIAVIGNKYAWIGTGAAARARVLRTSDGGHTWQVSDTPVAAAQSSGIFSIAFRDTKHGVVVGGDYRKENEAVNNLAFTNDGGATWTLGQGLSGFRSIVAYVSGTKTLVAIGPSGADISNDDGRTWKPIEGPGFDTFSFVRGKAVGWGAGAKGSLAKLVVE